MDGKCRQIIFGVCRVGNYWIIYLQVNTFCSVTTMLMSMGMQNWELDECCYVVDVIGLLVYWKITRLFWCFRFWSWFTIKMCRGMRNVDQHCINENWGLGQIPYNIFVQWLKIRANLWRKFYLSNFSQISSIIFVKYSLFI